MREIKFRGKRVDNGTWVYGQYFMTPLSDENSGLRPEAGWFFLTGEKRHCIARDGVSFVVIPESVGQYTGLKDKNGKEIYEGDVLRYTKVGGHSSRGIVKYVTEFARWEYWHTQQKQGFPVLSDHDNMEVIASIHETPELLEV